MVSPNGTGGSYIAVSDIDGPYAAMPPEAPAPGYGYGPTLLPPREVYTVVRENGFSPLGVPRQRGPFYTIAVIDRSGDDGRLVIDARNGRIVRFVPAYRMGNNFNEGTPPSYGPGGPLPPISYSEACRDHRPRCRKWRAARLWCRCRKRRRPASTRRRRWLPSPLPEKPAEPAKQSAAVQMKPADAPPAPQVTAPAAVETKPAGPQILPTQDMPKVQGLE